MLGSLRRSVHQFVERLSTSQQDSRRELVTRAAAKFCVKSKDTFVTAHAVSSSNSGRTMLPVRIP
jgi:hypothetical protein